MAFTAGSTYKIQDVYSIVTESKGGSSGEVQSDFNENDYTLPGGYLDQGVSITFAPDQTQVVANGSTKIKNEKISINFTLIGEAVYITQYQAFLKNNPVLTSMTVILNDGNYGTNCSSFYIVNPKIQAFEIVKANDTLKLQCSIEMNVGDADDVLTFIPR